jgi:hypothetical protein
MNMLEKSQDEQSQRLEKTAAACASETAIDVLS